MIKQDREKLTQKIQERAFIMACIAIVVLIISFLASFKSSYPYLFFIILSSAAIITGTVAFALSSKSLRMDLKNGETRKEMSVIINKKVISYQVPYETSKSDMLLTFLFSNRLMSRIKTVHKFFVMTENERLSVSEEEFGKIDIGQTITIRRGLKSNLYLGIEKIS